MLFSFRRGLAFLWLMCVGCTALWLCNDGFVYRLCVQRQCAALWRWQATKKCVGWRQHRRRLVCFGLCVLAQALAVPVGGIVRLCITAGFHSAAWLFVLDISDLYPIVSNLIFIFFNTIKYTC